MILNELIIYYLRIEEVLTDVTDITDITNNTDNTDGNAKKSESEGVKK